VFRRLELLKKSQNTRRRFGEFFVEGVKAITQARHQGWPVRSLVYAAGRPLSSWARETLDATPGAKRIELSARLMERLSDKHEPSEVIAIVGMRPDAPDRVKASRDLLVAVLDRPSSPGNLGSIIRSCYALGAGGLVVTGHGTDLYNPLTIRASMGALFALPMIRLPSHREVGRWVGDVAAARPARERAKRIQIVGATGDATLPVDAVDLTQPTVLVLGNEAEGLSAGFRELCDLLVDIPMYRGADSINVACAAAVLLYEADRQRRPRRRRRRAARRDNRDTGTT
jgi:TrmH family RNA methyltransferase